MLTRPKHYRFVIFYIGSTFRIASHFGNQYAHEKEHKLLKKKCFEDYALTVVRPSGTDVRDT